MPRPCSARTIEPALLEQTGLLAQLVGDFCCESFLDQFSHQVHVTLYSKKMELWDQVPTWNEKGRLFACGRSLLLPTLPVTASSLAKCDATSASEEPVRPAAACQRSEGRAQVAQRRTPRSVVSQSHLRLAAAPAPDANCSGTAHPHAANRSGPLRAQLLRVRARWAG